METIKDLFNYLKANKIIEDYTNIPLNGGIRHRLAGRGTNADDNKKGPTDQEVEEIINGWEKFVKDGNEVVKATKAKLKK